MSGGWREDGCSHDVPRPHPTSPHLRTRARPLKPPGTPAHLPCSYDARALVNKGVLLMQAERLEEARAAFAQASAIDPLLPEALYNSG